MGEAIKEPVPCCTTIIVHTNLLWPSLENLYEGYSSLLVTELDFNSRDGVFLHTTSDRNLFIILVARFRAKTKVPRVLIREMLIADDAALAAHSEETLQWLISAFSEAFEECSLTIRTKKTNVMGQDGRQQHPYHKARRPYVEGCEGLHKPYPSIYP